LITVYADDWSKRLCNGCYGQLLSIYEIKEGADRDESKAENLANLLYSMVKIDDQRGAERLLLASEARAKYLSPETLRFLATAEFLADKLGTDQQLEWSPAIIGLCKAVELEIINNIVRPLANRTGGMDLSIDLDDKDIARVATFCANQNRKPPELGAIAHFLQTVIHSRNRRNTSQLLQSFMQLASDWTGSHWILDQNGLHRSLTRITIDFRNKAAHIDELAELDYRNCRQIVMGPEGVLWRLATSVEKHH
jgi:hypothetical protein